MIRTKLGFLKRILTDSVYSDDIYNRFFETKEYPSEAIMEEVIASSIDTHRLEGTDWPVRGHTMIGLKRLNNIESSLDYIRENNIEGDIIETGVWRGGCCIFIKLYLDFYGMSKKVFVADSFEGLPIPDTNVYPQDWGDEHYKQEALKISLDTVKDNFKLYNALHDDNVVFLKGWFKDTLQDNKQIQKLAILRFDGDMYGSTMDVLNNLYKKVSKHGVIIVDDFGLPNCARAIHDFRGANNITEPYTHVDKYGIWWIKVNS